MRRLRQSDWRYLVPLLAVVSYAALVLSCAVDVPCWDDFTSILGGLSAVHNADSLVGKLKGLLAFHNEHRIGFVRSVAFADWKLTGKVNFKVLTYLGNLGLVFILFLFHRFAEQRWEADASPPATPAPASQWLLAAFALILFQPQYYDSVLWPTVLLSNYPVVYFAAAAFLLLEAPSVWGSIFAFLSAALGVFSLGNGVLIFPLAIACLLLRRQYRRATAWIVPAGALYAMYFSGMPPKPGGLHDLHLLRMMDHGLTFLGAGPAFGGHAGAVVVGIVEVAVFAWITLTRQYRNYPSLYLFFLYLLMTAGLNTLGRRELGPSYVLLQPRYKFLSALCLMATLLAIQGAIPPRLRLRFSRAALAVAVVFFTFSYWRYLDEVFRVRDTLLRGAAQWQVSRTGLYFPHQPFAAERIDAAKAIGLYELTSRQATPLVCKPEAMGSVVEDPPAAVGARDARFNLDVLTSGAGGVYLEGWIAPTGKRSLLQTVGVVLVGKTQTYRCGAYSVIRPDVRKALGDFSALRSGFAALIPGSELRDESYEITLEVSSGQAVLRRTTGRSFRAGVSGADGAAETVPGKEVR